MSDVADEYVEGDVNRVDDLDDEDDDLELDDELGDDELEDEVEVDEGNLADANRTEAALSTAVLAHVATSLADPELVPWRDAALAETEVLLVDEVGE